MSSTSPKTDAATQDSKDERTQPFNSAERLSIYAQHVQAFDDDATDSDASNSESSRNITPIAPSNDPAQKAASDAYVDYKIGAVRWYRQHKSVAHDVSLRIYKCAPNTARIRLCTQIYPTKSKKSDNKIAVYLYIYPEVIRAIELHKSADQQASEQEPQSCYSLHFNLKQRPSLVFAKDFVLASKNKTKRCLNLMKGLASTEKFTLQIDRSSATEQAIEDLNTLASTFSLNFARVRPCMDSRRADLDTLYAGKGGIVVQLKEFASHTEVKPPPYGDNPPNADQASKKKRRRIEDDDDTDRPLPPSDDFVSMFLRLEKLMTMKFQDMNTAIASRLDDVECSLKGLADKISEVSGDCQDQCRWSTAEREDIYTMVDEKIDEGIIDIKGECKDAIEELGQQASEIRGVLTRGVKRKMDRVLDMIDEVATETIEKKVQQAHLHINWT
ncbi:hypothetical protein V8C35DRAFT_291076 [Trichoderma chlorosporum]